MASLQRAVLMLRKLSLHGISRDIQDALTEQGDEEHEVSNEEGRKSNLEEKDYSEANLEVAFLHPSLRHHDVDSILKSGNSSSQFWR
jgi:hypothetical protein